MREIKGLVIENELRTIGFNISHVIMYEKTKESLVITLLSNNKIVIQKEELNMIDEVENIILKYWRNKK
jgi:hypothetical protein